MPPRRVITDLVEELRLPAGGSFIVLGDDGTELLRVDDADDEIRIRKTPIDPAAQGGAHPDQAAHSVGLGLATDAELAAAVTDHEAAANPHPTYETSSEAQAKVDAHAAAGDPHPGYATDGDLTAHTAAADPHAGYQRESEKGAVGGYASLDGGGTLPDAQIPASIARDSELPDLAGHVAAADPHTGYQREAEKAAASGYASLDGSTKVPVAQLPTGTTSSTVALGDAAAALDATHVAAADPHTGYQKESEKGAANGYAGLGSGGLVPIAQLASGTPNGLKFIRDDGTLVTPGGGDDARFTMRGLSSDQADITGTTLVELTALTVVGVGAGTYQFVYRVIYQTTATTTGVEFVVDHTGTVDRFASNAFFGSTGGTAATGIADQAGVGTAAGLMEVKTARAKNTRPGVTIGVDTANADMLMTIEGVLRVTASGDLKLFMAAELASLICRARAGSSLILTKVA